MSWDIIAEFANLMEKGVVTANITSLYLRPDTFITPGESFEALGNFTAIADLRQGNNGQLLDVLQLTYYFSCTDFKDFLYAVLGLADDITTNHCNLVVDYSQTIQEILIGLSRFFIVEKKSLKFLHLVSGPMGNTLDFLLSPEIKFIRYRPGMPSWVLDLTTKIFPCMPIDAPFSTGGSSSPQARVSADGRVLYLKIIDRIKAVGSLKDDVRLSLPPWIRSPESKFVKLSQTPKDL